MQPTRVQSLRTRTRVSRPGILSRVLVACQILEVSDDLSRDAVLEAEYSCSRAGYMRGCVQVCVVVACV